MIGRPRLRSAPWPLRRPSATRWTSEFRSPAPTHSGKSSRSIAWCRRGGGDAILVYPISPTALAAKAITVEDRVRSVSFALAPGEVLGIAGLQGMGQRELFLACFGAEQMSSGMLEVGGKPVMLSSPSDAVHARIGISMVPEDRKTEALLLKLDGQSNVSLPTLDRRSRFGFIDKAVEATAAAGVLGVVQVQDRALYTRVAAFSGGNQQKIAVAKWLLAESRVMLMYDPTRGVDVGTKHEIYVLIRGFAKAGGAVLFCSSEIPELVNLCDRVLVMCAGQIVSELRDDDICEEAIMRPALGAAERPERVLETMP